MVGFGIHTHIYTYIHTPDTFLSRIVLCLEVGLLLTLSYPPACVRYAPCGISPGGLPCTGRSFPLLLSCPQAYVRYAPCGISPGGLPCTGRWADTFSSFHLRSFTAQQSSVLLFLPRFLSSQPTIQFTLRNHPASQGETRHPAWEGVWG